MRRNVIRAFCSAIMVSGLLGCTNNSAKEYDRLIAKAMTDLQTKTAAHQTAWNIGAAERWDLNQDTGNLVFTFSNKVATCPAQIIGSYNPEKGTWMWAWHNKSIDERLTRDSRKLLELGKAKGYQKLTDPVCECTEDEAWQMAALATLHCNAQGAYRGPAAKSHVFMTFGKVNIEKKD